MTILLYYFRKEKVIETNKNNVLDDLYNLRARLPTEKEMKTRDKYLTNKIAISRINNKVPLYDVFSNNLYLINKEMVYHRVIRQHYRFPNETIINNIKEEIKELEKKYTNEDLETFKTQNLSDIQLSDEDYQSTKNKILETRKLRKFQLILDFLSNFDLKTLFDTYVRTFYYHSKEVGKNLTECKRPSFLPHFRHVEPYYSRSELINLGLNMEIIKSNNKYYEPEDIKMLCNKVSINDIKSSILLQHQKYIADNNKIGIVQYYSLQGAYFINQYMRRMTPYQEQNELLEKVIRSMWNLVKNSPAMDKEYIVYRFIKNDQYISHLKVGDIYTDTSFVSTTRDPFYTSEEFKFGYILLKIKLPKNVKGVGLCIETYSHFGKEEEILLPPKTLLKLTSKNEDCKYYHTDDKFQSEVVTRYEFTWIGNEDIDFIERPKSKEMEVIDFLKIDSVEAMTMKENVSYFSSKHTDNKFQFKTKIGDKEFTIVTEWYDSSVVYRPFYGMITNDGFSMYTIYKDHILFFIELGEKDGIKLMYVNYYFRHSSLPSDIPFNDQDFVTFLAKVGYYFKVPSILIYANYINCLDTTDYYGGTYCEDFYMYLKNKIKRFKNTDVQRFELRSKFDYFSLDKLRRSSPLLVNYKQDRDEIYQIYTKGYMPFHSEEKLNLGNFYVWLIENHCFLVPFLNEKMYRLFPRNNPFDNDFYLFDPGSYLYNRNIISSIPEQMDSRKGLTVESPKQYPMNRYRLEENKLRNRLSNRLSSS